MTKGYLHLEDGTILPGILRGFIGDSQGEVVFSTGMTGYCESLTDPSFANQILTFTYPLIGNYGVPKKVIVQPQLCKNFESEKIWVSGVLLSTLTDIPSHYECASTFENWCKSENIPILTGIDTRALTQKLREHGVMKGVIRQSKADVDWKKIDLKFNYSQVSAKRVIEYSGNTPKGKHIALIDCGVKHGIIRALLTIGYTVTRVPYNVNPYDIHPTYDGIVVSNGPGDPKDWPQTIDIISSLLKKGTPFIGVCLGHQLLALALGADTYKLKYGHRGLNQPVMETQTKRCYLTSQNHGFAVKSESIPKSYKTWFTNLNDGTNEGLKNDRAKVWSSQFHPEGNPGPYDSLFIFEKFMET